MIVLRQLQKHRRNHRDNRYVIFSLIFHFPILQQGDGQPLSVPLLRSILLCTRLTRSLAILCLGCSLFLGCVTGEKITRISTGMTTGEVRAILGNPNGVRMVEGHEVYIYSNRLISGWSYDRTDFNVIFETGRVVEYGPGEVRPGAKPNTVFIFPMKGF